MWSPPSLLLPLLLLLPPLPGTSLCNVLFGSHSTEHFCTVPTSFGSLGYDAHMQNEKKIICLRHLITSTAHSSCQIKKWKVKIFQKFDLFWAPGGWAKQWTIGAIHKNKKKRQNTFFHSTCLVSNWAKTFSGSSSRKKKKKSERNWAYNANMNNQRKCLKTTNKTMQFLLTPAQRNSIFSH